VVGEAFRLQRFSVTKTGGGGRDGGVDLVLSKGSEKFLVQCKQWKAYTVGVAVVRELYGVMTARNATGGVVVTSGSFSDDAKAFVEGRNVRLVDGDSLVGMIRQAQHLLSSRSGLVERPRHVVPAMLPDVEVGSLPCPACGSKMMKRTAKKGANASGKFWGCSRYPSCHGVRSIA